MYKQFSTCPVTGNNFIDKTNRMKKKTALLAFAFSLLLCRAGAQNFWSRADEQSLTARNNVFEKNYKPAAFISFKLDEAAFKKQLTTAPSEKSITAGKSAFIVSVPNADGKIERFKVVEAPVMQPGLAAKYPSIKAYAGKGIDEPTSTIRFDITPNGFHGMILSAVRKTIYINPVDNAAGAYIVFKRDAPATGGKVFDCRTQQIASSAIQGAGRGNGSTAKNADDGKLRTFRFAVATGGEFSKLFLNGSEATDSGKKVAILAGLVTDLVRVNGIMETDFGIRLQYVNNEDTLFYLDPKSDPFTSSNSGADGIWNRQIQKTLDSTIGTKNYDVGHLLMGFNTGGDAGCIGCGCVNKQKGSGFTGFLSPLGDPFVVDYWAHEIGHQFGGFHTFDYYDEGTEAQMEPGSGSTIMGYAGVADEGQNIQFNSDPYFHAISIKEITDYVQTGDGAGCAVATNTGNHAPVITKGKSYTIPKLTPFKLTGQATDADIDDMLTFCWEQFDTYEDGTSTVIPKATTKTGPVFRSLNPDTLPYRTFPIMANILDGKNKNKWEVLSSAPRTLKFRLTVRDNQPGHGANSSDDVVVTVDTSAGAFRVKSPNTGLTWQQGTDKIIEWDVANTDNAAINCKKVKILLSTDGGKSFDRVLASAADNTGSKTVTLPNINSKQCRIMVQAVGNIFFDVSDSDFTIAGALPVHLLSFTARQQKQDVLLNWTTENELNNNYFDVEKSIDNSHFNTIGRVSAVAPGTAGMHAYNFTDSETFAGVAYYRLKQVDKDGLFAYSNIIAVKMNMPGTLWSVYPNPAVGKTTLHIKANISNVTVQLINTAGQTVYGKTLSTLLAGQVVDVPLRSLAKGVYLLRIQTGKDVRTEKIIVR